MQAGKKGIAVAGATGNLGRHVVNVLKNEGHDVVAMSRSLGVDVKTGDGLAEALQGVERVIDVASGHLPEQGAATEFFAAAARNLQRVGERAGVRRMVVVSIIGCDRFAGGSMSCARWLSAGRHRVSAGRRSSQVPKSWAQRDKSV